MQTGRNCVYPNNALKKKKNETHLMVRYRRKHFKY